MTKSQYAKWRFVWETMQFWRKAWETPGVLGDDERRIVTRLFYDTIGVTATGYESLEYKKLRDSGQMKKGGRSLVTKDHYMTPQWIARMIMDLADIYLEDFDKFIWLVEQASQTIWVTVKENDELRGQSGVISKYDGINHFIEVSVKDKYAKAGIILDHKEFDKRPKRLKEFPEHLIPQEVLDYERQFLRKAA